MNLLLEFKIVFSAVWGPGRAATGWHTRLLLERRAQQNAAQPDELHVTVAMREGAS